MTRFNSAASLARKLIDKNGQQAILRRYVDASVPNPDQPWRAGSAAFEDVSVSAVFLDASDLGQEYATSSEVHVGQKLALIAGDSLVEAPGLRDRLYRDGGGSADDGFAIVGITTLDPNGQKILHELRLRN